jgi:hypothetical protein
LSQSKHPKSTSPKAHHMVVSSFRVAVALALLQVTGSTAWVAAPTPAGFGIRGVAACGLRSVQRAGARRCAVGGLRANSENEQGGEREQSSMDSWNEIMYSELRRRGAVTPAQPRTLPIKASCCRPAPMSMDTASSGLRPFSLQRYLGYKKALLEGRSVCVFLTLRKTYF